MGWTRLRRGHGARGGLTRGPEVLYTTYYGVIQTRTALLLHGTPCPGGVGWGPQGLGRA